MQLRHEWVAVTIPYDGSTMWKKSVVGTPDMSNINYISITAENNANNFTLYVDAMKSVSVEETKANAYVQSIAQDGTAIYSTATESSDADAIISGTVDNTVTWESENGDEDIWYGVDLGTERYLDRVDYYLYYEPVGNPSLDTLVMPNDVVVEYDEDGEWKEVPNVTMGTITSNRNIVTFDTIKTSKVRVKFTTANNAPVALYGFHVFNTENYMTELNYEEKPVAQVTSSVVSDIVLDTVEIWGSVTNASLWDSDIHDLELYIYETDASQTGPNGKYLAKGIIEKDSVDPSELPKLFQVELRDDDGNQITLEAGKKYVLLMAMERDYSNTGQAGWRFPTSTAIEGETFGKVTGLNNNYSSINGFTVEALGTGWLRVYEEGSDVPVIDYSFEHSGKTGWGVGLYTEDSRYQTFTIPEATIMSVLNGNVNDAWSWSFEEEEGSIYIGLDEEKEINLINIALEEGGIPASMTILNGDEEVLTMTAEELTAGMNEIILDEAITAKDLTFVFTAGENAVQVSEIELMNLTESTPDNPDDPDTPDDPDDGVKVPATNTPGWHKIEGEWYYYDANSNIVTGWRKINSKWYYFDKEDAAMVYGWNKIDNKWYYFGTAEDGAMKSGWQKLSGNWYFFGGADDGVMRSGWSQINGKWYYFGNAEDGAMKYGWQQIKGSWYYFGSADDGAMKTGWQKVDGSWYYMYSDGKMASSTWIGNCYVDESGKWVKSR